MVADRLTAAPVVAASSASGRRAGRYCQDLWMGVFQATSASVDLMGGRVLSALNRVSNPNQTSWVVGAVVPLCHPVTDAGFNLRSRIGTNVPTPFTVRRNASGFPRPAVPLVFQLPAVDGDLATRQRGRSATGQPGDHVGDFLGHHKAEPLRVDDVFGPQRHRWQAV
jgi:hypothetical protein